MKPPRKTKVRAFTLIELLAIIAMAAILLALLLPAGSRKTPAYTARCMSNQRQIAMGLILWKSDHNEHFPWQLSVTNDGTAEYIPRGEAAPHFRILSNNLKYPEIFHCPSDPSRRWPSNTMLLDNTNLSYFAAMDVGASLPSSSILTGDRNLDSNGKPVTAGLFTYSTNMTINWTRRLLHSQSSAFGILSFADGHVERVRDVNLNSVFRREGLPVDHLCVP